MSDRFLRVILLLVLLVDLGFSGLQHYRRELDGDLANLALPGPGYEQIFDSPFGQDALIKGEQYGGANRYFSHLATSWFYHHIPQLLQRLFTPVESVYLANAIFKLSVQIGLILLLVLYALRRPRQNITLSLLLAVLATMLFQTFGSRYVMGIIDPATTYVFFYALPSFLLLLWYLPTYRKLRWGDSGKSSVFTIFLLLAGAIILPFSGPLIPPVALLISGSLLFLAGLDRFSAVLRARLTLPRVKLPFLGIHFFLLLLSGYSMWLGGYNPEAIQSSLPLSDRYAQLAVGIGKLLTIRPGLLFLLLATSINYWLLIKKDFLTRSLHQLFILLSVFGLLYMLLLPLGGYREYRPQIVRWDTIQPVVLALAILFISSSAILIQQLRKHVKIGYSAFLFLLFCIYTGQDAEAPYLHACEKELLHEIAASPRDTILLKDDCRLMSWEVIRDPEAAHLNGVMLQVLGVTERHKVFYYSE